MFSGLFHNKKTARFFSQKKTCLWYQASKHGVNFWNMYISAVDDKPACKCKQAVFV